MHYKNTFSISHGHLISEYTEFTDSNIMQKVTAKMFLQRKNLCSIIKTELRLAEMEDKKTQSNWC